MLTVLTTEILGLELAKRAQHRFDHTGTRSNKIKQNSNLSKAVHNNYALYDRISPVLEEGE